MTGETLIVVLPLVAAAIALLTVLGAWFMWTTPENEDGNATDDISYQSAAGMVAPSTPKSPQAGSVSPPKRDEGEELMVGEVFGQVAGFFQSLIGRGETKPPTTQTTREYAANLPTDLPQVTPQMGVPIPVAPVPTAIRPQAYNDNTIEVLRILRDLADGSLIVEINGQRYRDMTAIADQSIARRLIGNASDLSRFAGGETIASIPDPVLPDFLSVPPQTVSAPTPIPLATDAESSMAGEIEALLQARLIGNPDLAGRNIHIHEAVGGGVSIEVDGEFYEGIADLQEESIRVFIQSIIHEWEAQQ